MKEEGSAGRGSLLSFFEKNAAGGFGLHPQGKFRYPAGIIGFVGILCIRRFRKNQKNKKMDLYLFWLFLLYWFHKVFHLLFQFCL